MIKKFLLSLLLVTSVSCTSLTKKEVDFVGIDKATIVLSQDNTMRDTIVLKYTADLLREDLTYNGLAFLEVSFVPGDSEDTIKIVHPRLYRIKEYSEHDPSTYGNLLNLLYKSLPTYLHDRPISAHFNTFKMDADEIRIYGDPVAVVKGRDLYIKVVRVLD